MISLVQEGDKKITILFFEPNLKSTPKENFALIIQDTLRIK
jgi:hypothetical protein